MFIGVSIRLLSLFFKNFSCEMGKRGEMDTKNWGQFLASKGRQFHTPLDVLRSSIRTAHSCCQSLFFPLVFTSDYEDRGQFICVFSTRLC